MLENENRGKDVKGSIDFEMWKKSTKNMNFSFCVINVNFLKIKITFHVRQPPFPWKERFDISTSKNGNLHTQIRIFIGLWDSIKTVGYKQHLLFYFIVKIGSLLETVMLENENRRKDVN